MALIEGTRLGPYEITGSLGAGGMGEVYRATDTKLKRQVAIKTLPLSVAGDPDRLARFQREAEVLASLNHPNIAAIYGLEEADPSAGSGQAAVKAIVMELVEGPTLAERVEQVTSHKSQGATRQESNGGLPLDEALAIARQIADALEAAHEQAIVHRDLKPANIKLRPDGVVKVLDFGLAKLNVPNVPNDPNAPNASQSPTITTPAMTQAGMILGTAAYMSPEQAKGRPADKRSDIWSFGAVLYEMLTGRRAFEGEDIADTLAFVLTKEPDWDLLPQETPLAVRTLLRGCLARDRRQRIGDIAAVKFVLNHAELTAAGSAARDPASVLKEAARDSAYVLRETAAAQTDAAVASAREEAARVMQRGVRLASVAAAVLVATIGAASIWYAMRLAPAVTAPPETRTDIVTPETTDPLSFALSPDGRQVVFVASGDGPSRLWLRPLASATAQPLTGTEGGLYPFWSPDSRSIGFFAEGRLKRLDIGGGAPQVLAGLTGAPRGGAWNAEGVILFAGNTNGPLVRVSATGGEPAAVTKLDRQNSHRFPQFLPDGRRFLFYAMGSPETEGIYLGSLDSSDVKRLTPGESQGAYAPGGWLLWMRGGTLVAQRLDDEQGALVGDPVTVADQVAFNGDIRSGAFSAAAGSVAYRGGGGGRRELRWFDRAGKVLGTLGGPDDSYPSYPRLSPDGRRVAVFRAVQGNADVWLLDGTRMSRFTFDASLDRYAWWSPDGSRIAFDSNRKGRRDLYTKESSGAGNEEILLESPQDKAAQDWSADGRFIMYATLGDPQTGNDIWVLPLEGDRKPLSVLTSSFNERGAQFSPDGQWVTYASDESGRYEVYVRRFVEPARGGADSGGGVVPTGGQWQVSTAGGMFPAWRRDGRELFYVAPDGRLMAVAVAARGMTFEPGTPVALFLPRMLGGGTNVDLGRQYDVARDGRFLVNTVLDDATVPITLIQNWTPAGR